MLQPHYFRKIVEFEQMFNIHIEINRNYLHSIRTLEFNFMPGKVGHSLIPI